MIRITVLLLSAIVLLGGCEAAWSPVSTANLSSTYPTATATTPSTIAIGDNQTEYFSSVNLPEETLQLFQGNPNNHVIRFYLHPHTPYLGSGHSLNEILERSNCAYAIINKYWEIEYTHTHVTQKGCSICGTSIKFDLGGVLEYIVYPELVFPSDVTVRNIICVDGTRGWHGISIFYYTDHGDYVLYREYGIKDELFLIPLEDYYQLTVEYWGTKKGEGYLEGRERYPFTPIELEIPPQLS